MSLWQKATQSLNTKLKPQYDVINNYAGKLKSLVTGIKPTQPTAPINSGYSMANSVFANTNQKAPQIPGYTPPAGAQDLNVIKSNIAKQQATQNQQQPTNQYTQQPTSNQQPFYSGVGSGVGGGSNNNYSQQAQQEYDVVYNAQVNALKNRITSLMSGMDQQKTGINMNYDGAVTNQNRQNTMSQNNFNNETNSRGLGRSSIATTGLGAMDVINNREVAGIDSRRSNDLNMVDAQKMALESERENTLGQMEGDRANAIMVLARQLEDRDFSKQMQRSELSMKQTEMTNRIKQMNYDYEQSQKQNEDSKKGFSQFEFDTYNQYTSQVDGIMSSKDMTTKQKQAELDRLKKSFSSNYIINQDMRPEMRDNINSLFNVPSGANSASSNNSLIGSAFKPIGNDFSAMFEALYTPKDKWNTLNNYNANDIYKSAPMQMLGSANRSMYDMGGQLMTLLNKLKK